MQSLIRERIASGLSSVRHVLLRGVSGSLVSPLRRSDLATEVYTGLANLTVAPDRPVKGVDILFGNEIA